MATGRTDSGLREQTVYWIQRYTQISPLAGMSLKSFKRVACTDGESSSSLQSLCQCSD